MPARRLPVHPDLVQLKHQAKDLLRAIRRGDPGALADVATYHPDGPDPATTRLADAQFVLARSYDAPSWPRLVLACRMADAIWEDDVEAVRALVREHPTLLHESVLVRESNWGLPMSYAANLGRDRMITMLHELGATDHAHALGRATLQGRIETARMLHAMLGSPRPARDTLGGPAYTLSVSGTALMLELGATVTDASGRCTAPVDVVIQSDSRNPAAKHEILEMYLRHGAPLPDTPMMALHRGRFDLLETHLRRDPGLLSRTFRYEEIFPPGLGCHDEQLPRTTLAGATLLHVCVEFDELEIARWLLAQGMKVDVPAATDPEGFGGHTALFGAVVCYANFWGNYRGGLTDSPFARLLLDHGADPNARALLRERIQRASLPGKIRVDDVWVTTERRDVTPLGWGQVFGYRMVVSEPAMQLIVERGGGI